MTWSLILASKIREDRGIIANSGKGYQNLSIVLETTVINERVMLLLKTVHQPHDSCGHRKESNEEEEELSIEPVRKMSGGSRHEWTQSDLSQNICCWSCLFRISWLRLIILSFSNGEKERKSLDPRNDRQSQSVRLEKIARIGSESSSSSDGESQIALCDNSMKMGEWRPMILFSTAKRVTMMGRSETTWWGDGKDHLQETPTTKFNLNNLQCAETDRSEWRGETSSGSRRSKTPKIMMRDVFSPCLRYYCSCLPARADSWKQTRSLLWDTDREFDTLLLPRSNVCAWLRPFEDLSWRDARSSCTFGEKEGEPLSHRQDSWRLSSSQRKEARANHSSSSWKGRRTKWQVSRPVSSSQIWQGVAAVRPWITSVNSTYD